MSELGRCIMQKRSSLSRLTSLVCATNRPHLLANVIANVERQGKAVELVLICDRWEPNAVALSYIDRLEAAQVWVFDDDCSLGTKLNHGIHKSHGEWIGKIDDDDYYSRYYLDEAKSFSDFCDLTGKSTWFAWMDDLHELYEVYPRSEFCHIDYLAGGTLFAKSDVFKRYLFPELDLGEDQGFIGKVIAGGGSVCCSSRFNYVQFRNTSIGNHTWAVSTETYIRHARFVSAECSEHLFGAMPDIDAVRRQGGPRYRDRRVSHDG